MGDNRENSKKVFNEQTPFKTHRRSWDTGRCVPTTVEGCEGYVLEALGSACDSLKTNFFTMELMEVSSDSKDSLAQFMGRYGLLDCPYREGSIPPAASLELISCIEETDAVRDVLNKKLMIANIDLCLETSSPNPASLLYPSHFVSHDEAAAVLTLFQETVRGLIRCLEGEKLADPRLFDFININASNHEQVSYIESPVAAYPEGVLLAKASSIGSLTGAIANQIIETIADDAPWYRCKAPDCRRWFKRKRGTDSPRTNSEYCSVTCSERMHKRKQRAPEAPDARAH